MSLAFRKSAPFTLVLPAIPPSPPITLQSASTTLDIQSQQQAASNTYTYWFWKKYLVTTASSQIRSDVLKVSISSRIQAVIPASRSRFEHDDTAATNTRITSRTPFIALSYLFGKTNIGIILLHRNCVDLRRNDEYTRYLTLHAGADRERRNGRRTYRPL